MRSISCWGVEPCWVSVWPLNVLAFKEPVDHLLYSGLVILDILRSISGEICIVISNGKQGSKEIRMWNCQRQDKGHKGHLLLPESRVHWNKDLLHILTDGLS